jgi:hypothetical protein
LRADFGRLAAELHIQFQAGGGPPNHDGGRCVHTGCVKLLAQRTFIDERKTMARAGSEFMRTAVLILPDGAVANVQVPAADQIGLSSGESSGYDSNPLAIPDPARRLALDTPARSRGGLNSDRRNDDSSKRPA